MDVLADYLAERHLLLILDTCEHLVDACAKLAEALLLAAPRLRILATSREPLGVGGEQVQLISPLEVPDFDEDTAGSDSVALFADRAEAMVPGFMLTAANQPPVVQLCRRLDGIPLTLELAAVRLRAMFESYRQRGLELSVAEAIAVARNEVPVPADEISADPLTRREREIAELMTQGLGNREIAEQLVLAKRTVDSHIEHIFSKLGFTSRTQLAAWVSQQNAN